MGKLKTECGTLTTGSRFSEVHLAKPDRDVTVFDGEDVLEVVRSTEAAIGEVGDRD